MANMYGKHLFAKLYVIIYFLIEVYIVCKGKRMDENLTFFDSVSHSDYRLPETNRTSLFYIMKGVPP